MAAKFDVNEMVTTLKALVEKRSPEVAAVDREEVDRLPTARREFEEHLDTIESLAERAGVELPKASLADMRAALAAAAKLDPLQRVLETDVADLRIDVSNRAELLRRKAYKIFILYYQSIRAAVEADPTLKTSFSHLEDIFTLPPRPKKATVNANEDIEKPADPPKVVNG